MKNLPQHKVFTDWEDAARLIDYWKDTGMQVVFTNGCFDLLHRGHIHYLKEAASLGDKLVIGLNSDASVSRLKGSDRPIMDEDSRSTILAAMEDVDAVILFSEDTPLALIEKISPDILVKGGDYRPEAIVGYDHVTQMGGEVMSLQFVEGFSTSTIIDKIKKTTS